MVCPGMMLLLGRKSPSGGRMSRNGGAFGEEMHFFGGAGRVCPGMGSVSGMKCISLRVCPGMELVSGRKCISLVGLGEFVPDLGDFRGERAFLGEFVPE